MSDGVAITAGTGTNVATDDAGASGHVQIIKLAIGTDGSATVIPADATNGLKVDVARIVAVALDATTLAALETTELGATTLAALESITIGTALPAGTAVIGKVGHDTTGGGVGRKVVTTAGTRVDLASTTTAKWVIVTAETDNTGAVVAGPGSVIAALATRVGTPLAAGDSASFLIDDLADIKLDSEVNGDGVTFSYGT